MYNQSSTQQLHSYLCLYSNIKSIYNREVYYLSILFTLGNINYKKPNVMGIVNDAVRY